MLQISQYLFSQASRTTAAVFRERRQLAFDKLGFDKHSDGAFVESLPFHGPFLFAGQLLDSVDQQFQCTNGRQRLRHSLSLGCILDALLRFRPFEAEWVEDAGLCASPPLQVRIFGGLSFPPVLDSAVPEVVDEAFFPSSRRASFF